jgi:hypothetical protein
VPDPPSHTTTARPSRAIATAGLTPWARVTGAVLTDIEDGDGGVMVDGDEVAGNDRTT